MKIMNKILLAFLLLAACGWSARIDYTYPLAPILDNMFGGPVVAIDGRIANGKAIDRMSSDSGVLSPNVKDTTAWRWDSCFVYNGATIAGSNGVQFGRRRGLEEKRRIIIAANIRIKNTNAMQGFVSYATSVGLNQSIALYNEASSQSISFGVSRNTPAHEVRVSYASISSAKLMPPDSVLTIVGYQDFVKNKTLMYINGVSSELLSPVIVGTQPESTFTSPAMTLLIGSYQASTTLAARAGCFIDNVYIFTPADSASTYDLQKLSLALMQTQVVRARGQSNTMVCNNRESKLGTSSMFSWVINEPDEFPAAAPIILLKDEQFAHIPDRSSFPALGDSIVKKTTRPMLTIGSSRGGHGIANTDNVVNYATGGGVFEDYWARRYNEPQAVLFPATVNAEKRLGIPAKVSFWMGESDPYEIGYTGGISYADYVGVMDTVVKRFNDSLGTTPFEVIGMSGRYTSYFVDGQRDAKIFEVRKAHWQYAKADPTKRIIGYNMLQAKGFDETRTRLLVPDPSLFNPDNYVKDQHNMRGKIKEIRGNEVWALPLNPGFDSTFKNIGDFIFEYADSACTIPLDGSQQVMAITRVAHVIHNTAASHSGIIAKQKQYCMEYLYGLRDTFGFPELKCKIGLSTTKKVLVTTHPKQGWSVQNGNYRSLWTGKQTTGSFITPTVATKKIGPVVDTLVLTFASAVDSVFYARDTYSGLKFSEASSRLVEDTLDEIIITDDSGFAAYGLCEMFSTSVIDSIRPVSIKRGAVVTVYGSIPDSSGSIGLRINGLNCSLTRWSNGQAKAIIPTSAPRGYYWPNLNLSGTFDTALTRIRVLVPEIISGGK